MIDVKALTAVLLGLILREAPNVAQHPELQQQFNDNIAQMVTLHLSASDGRLVNRDMDVLILAAVNYRETRMRLPAPPGDCQLTHRLYSTPSMDWPKGYVPVWKTVCRAVGPMQLALSTRKTIAAWSEVQELLPWRYLAAENFEEHDFPFEESEFEDPGMNVRIAYGALDHWKTVCSAKNPVPIGVLFTAYRYGHCPAKQKNSGHYYIDEEARTRCKLVFAMMSGMHDLDVPASYACTYEDLKKE